MSITKQNVAHDESTMNHCLQASACMLLLKLKEHYHLNEKIFDTIIANFKQKLAAFIKEQADQSKYAEWTNQLDALCRYIDDKVGGLTEFDSPYYYQNNKLNQLTIPLKEVFALVCMTMFDLQDPYERGDDTWKNGFADRMEILYSCWLRLMKRDVANCNVGARHALAMTLCHIHPAADIIVEDLDLFMQSKVADYIGEIFKKLSGQQQMACFKQGLQGKIQVVDLDLEQYLIKACKEHGISPVDEYTKQCITQAIAGKNNISFLSYMPELAKYGACLMEFNKLAQNIDEKDELKAQIIKKASKQMEECEELQDLKNVIDNGLADLVFINDSAKYIQKFSKILTWYVPSEQIMQLAQNLEIVQNKIKSYCEGFVSGFVDSERLVLLEAIQNSFTPCQLQLEMLNQENYTDDVVNFFAKYDAVRSHDNKSELINSIVDKTPAIIFLDDTAIITAFSNTQAGEIVLNPYIVNRMLLHASLVPRSEWSQTFTQYLLQVLEYLQQLPNDDSANGNLKKASYPAELTGSFQLLYDPIKITDVYMLERVLILLPEKNRMNFLEYLGVNAIKVINKHASQLTWLRLIPEERRLKVLSWFNIKTMFNYIGDLCELLELLPVTSRMECLLSHDIQSKIRTVADLGYLLILLPQENQAEVLAWWGKEKIVAQAATLKDLCRLLRSFPEQERTGVLQWWDIKAIEKIINEDKPEKECIIDLHTDDLLGLLPVADRLEFLEKLSNKTLYAEFVPTRGYGGARALLGLLPEARRTEFLLKHKEQLNFDRTGLGILELLPKAERWQCLSQLNVPVRPNLENVAEDYFTNLLKLISREDRMEFYKWLDIKIIIRCVNQSKYNSVLSIPILMLALLPEKDKPEFLADLIDTGCIVRIIKTFADLNRLLTYAGSLESKGNILVALGKVKKISAEGIVNISGQLGINADEVLAKINEDNIKEETETKSRKM